MVCPYACGTGSSEPATPGIRSCLCLPKLVFQSSYLTCAATEIPISQPVLKATTPVRYLNSSATSSGRPASGAKERLFLQRTTWAGRRPSFGPLTTLQKSPDCSTSKHPPSLLLLF